MINGVRSWRSIGVQCLKSGSKYDLRVTCSLFSVDRQPRGDCGGGQLHDLCAPPALKTTPDPQSADPPPATAVEATLSEAAECQQEQSRPEPHQEQSNQG